MRITTRHTLVTTKLGLEEIHSAKAVIISDLKKQAIDFCRSDIESQHAPNTEITCIQYLIRWENRIVAFFVLHSELNFAKLTELYILPTYFEEYGGSFICNEIRKEARKLEANFLTVWSKESMHSFFEKLGGKQSKIIQTLGVDKGVEYYIAVVEEPWVDLPTAGLVCVDGNKLLLAFSKNKQAWYLPGGKIDLGEDSETALIREIEEELSLILQPNRLFFLTHIIAPAFGEKKNILMRQDCYHYNLEGDTITIANEIGGVQYFSKEEYVRTQIPVPGVLKVFDFLATYAF